MSDPRHLQRLELENLALNLEYAFNRGVDLSARVIQLTEDIEEFHFGHFDAAMTCLEKLNRKAITIKINSYGGDMYAALGIVGRMLESPCYVHTKGYGKIMSAATLILAAGKKRSISNVSQFMHHEVSAEVGGRLSQLDHEISLMKREETLWCNLMSQFTSQDPEFWKQKGRGLDYYLTPSECLELNVVDEVF